MKADFLKMCAEDFTCQEMLPFWQRKFSVWTIPSEAGFCVMSVSDSSFTVDSTHKFNDKSWVELDQSSMELPAKESWVPLKTYIQSECHQTKKCGVVGNWQGKIDSLDTKTPLPDIYAH